MGYYVGVCLSFPANNSEEGLKLLSEAASRTLGELPDEPEGKHVRWLCELVIEDPNRYVHGGNNGDMFVWSGVWNYYSFGNEEDALKTFLLNCWRPHLEGRRNRIMFDSNRALLIVNPEQSEHSYMYGFRLKENGEGKYLPEVIVDKDVSELSWNRY